MPVGLAPSPSVAAQAAADYRARAPKQARGIWVTISAFTALTSFLVLSYLLVPWASVLSWAAQEQRGFQNAMAGSLRAIRGGDSFAVFTLCSATALYGFVHALGPGHGKVLLGGAALGGGGLC